MYRTTDSQYKPTYAITTLFIPSYNNGTNTSSNPTLLSYQYPYDAVDLNLSPSYAMYAGMPVEDISWGLSRGWYVITGDYEGPLASFSAGVMSGHAVLDGIRAVLSDACAAEFFGLSSPTVRKRSANSPPWRYALWGYSGGAVASEFAAELQVQYAPELQFAGVAIGGLTPNISTIRDLVEGTLYASLTPSWLIGVTSQYPDARDYLISVLNKAGPYNVTTFMGLAQSTSTLVTFAFERISDYFVNGFADLETPIINKIITSDNTMGYHGVPQMPVFAYKAVHDELSAVADTDKLIDRYCELPAVDIFYQRNEVGGHGDESTAGNPRARAWLIEVLQGTYTETGCRIETIVDVAA
ncbi:putative lipase 1 precursor protein [Phaeoacremonium minimum UCRPA7]|uniref:Putative lipase 1 protein n=1 Tax=Phaeoacremonium minimum (strain UCR-PA7) TaxID=1286976 RepID=R8BEW5_PHAM7|nr:putative lipase 1 precursor protein [Phaeoacremonium minimum UCRPA7]EON97840.1 putative lipase 1 precursor protein [Phaeoacremonium minimum UCRPA7]